MGWAGGVHRLQGAGPAALTGCASAIRWRALFTRDSEDLKHGRYRWTRSTSISAPQKRYLRSGPARREGVRAPPQGPAGRGRQGRHRGDGHGADEDYDMDDDDDEDEDDIDEGDEEERRTPRKTSSMTRREAGRDLRDDGVKTYPPPAESPIAFNTFIIGLASTALIHLGDTANPETGRTERNLELARREPAICCRCCTRRRAATSPAEEEKLFDHPPAPTCACASWRRASGEPPDCRHPRACPAASASPRRCASSSRASTGMLSP